MIRSIRQCMTINAACPHNGYYVNRVKGFSRLGVPEARSILCLGVLPLGKKLARGGLLWSNRICGELFRTEKFWQ